jgi:hypothetical protein
VDNTIANLLQNGTATPFTNLWFWLKLNASPQSGMPPVEVATSPRQQQNRSGNLNTENVISKKTVARSITPGSIPSPRNR